MWRISAQSLPFTGGTEEKEHASAMAQNPKSSPFSNEIGCIPSSPVGTGSALEGNGLGYMEQETNGNAMEKSRVNYGASLPDERRRRVRVGVKWEVRFGGGGKPPISSFTDNLSSEGIYCIANQSIPAGDHMCIIMIPAHAPNDARQVLCLHCNVQVLRVELKGEQKFGIAARIRGYRAVTHSSIQQ